LSCEGGALYRGVGLQVKGKMRIRFLDFGGQSILKQQWARFKRREESLMAVIGVAVLLHVIFWIIWYIGVAPYPTAFTVQVPFDLGPLDILHDYFWPIVNLIFLGLNIFLIFQFYKKDIFASWLLVGASILLQVLILAITLYLVSFVGL
jgi:hypothetical protein